MENPETKVKQFYVYKILIPCCSCPCKYKDTSSGRKQELLTQGIHELGTHTRGALAQTL